MYISLTREAKFAERNIFYIFYIYFKNLAYFSHSITLSYKLNKLTLYFKQNKMISRLFSLYLQSAQSNGTFPTNFPIKPVISVLSCRQTDKQTFSWQSHWQRY